MVGKVWELSRGKVSSFPEVDADRPRLVCRQDLVLPYEVLVQSRSTSTSHLPSGSPGLPYLKGAKEESCFTCLSNHDSIRSGRLCQ